MTELKKGTKYADFIIKNSRTTYRTTKEDSVSLAWKETGNQISHAIKVSSNVKK